MPTDHGLHWGKITKDANNSDKCSQAHTAQFHMIEDYLSLTVTTSGKIRHSFCLY